MRGATLLVGRIGLIQGEGKMTTAFEVNDPRSVPRVSFIRALFDLFYISLVRFQPKARVFAWNLVAANTAGLFFLPRPEPAVLWASILIGLVFMARVYQKMGFVRLLGTGHSLWVLVVPWLAQRWAHLPSDAGGPFEAWLLWVILTNATSLILDCRDAVGFMKGDRTAYYSFEPRRS
jgi:hypothetical protein